MGMFDNYNNQNTNYIPNNMGYAGQKPLAYPIPYAEYNVEGQQTGYYWYYGDTVNLTFNLIGELTVETGSIVYYQSGQAPTTETEGQVGQRAYNVYDLISWTCTAIEEEYEETTYIWTQDQQFTYPDDGQKGVYVPAARYVNGMTAQIKIYNFRFEEVYSFTTEARDKVTLSIGKDLSEKLIRGTYYITLTLVNETNQTYLQLFKDKECVITVK